MRTPAKLARLVIVVLLGGSLLSPVGCGPPAPSKNTPVPDVEPAHPMPMEGGMQDSTGEATGFETRYRRQVVIVRG